MGAGHGELTRWIAEKAAKVIAIEIDKHFRKDHQSLALSNVEWIYQDALTFPWQETLSKEKWVVLGNLPFVITTPLLFQLFAYLASIEKMGFLIQKEVATRITSQVGSSDYGRLSVAAQTYCSVQLRRTISRANFFPVPKVDSAWLEIVPKENIVLDLNFLQFLKRGFTHRRKKLRHFLIAEDIDPQKGSAYADLRPQNLSPENWLDLYKISRHKAFSYS